MSEQTKPWLILPCSGIGKALGTISRWAAYELLDRKTIPGIRLMCLARLVDADPEALEIIKSHQIITLDGCPKKCASVNVERNGGKVIKSYLMAKFIVKHKDLKFANDVLDPGPGGAELAKCIASDIEQDVVEMSG
jgi:uncharacterized metal-binding protein